MTPDFDRTFRSCTYKGLQLSVCSIDFWLLALVLSDHARLIIDVHKIIFKKNDQNHIQNFVYICEKTNEHFGELLIRFGR